MKAQQPSGRNATTAEADKTHQDGFPAAPIQEEEGVSMGAVLEELGLSNTLRPLPAESAPETAKASGALQRKHTSSRSTAASRRTTQTMQQDPRCSTSHASLNIMTCMPQCISNWS